MTNEEKNEKLSELEARQRELADEIKALRETNTEEMRPDSPGEVYEHKQSGQTVMLTYGNHAIVLFNGHLSDSRGWVIGNVREGIVKDDRWKHLGRIIGVTRIFTDEKEYHLQVND